VSSGTQSAFRCGQGVLCIQGEIGQVREDPQDGQSRFLFQPVQTGLQEGQVATEPVDDEPFDACPFCGCEEGQGSDQVGKDSAPVDVGHQQDRAICGFGKPHVRDVIFPEIDFCRGARSLHQNHPMLPCETFMRRQYDGEKFGLVVLVGSRFQMRRHFSQDNDLCALIGDGFEKNGVHVDVRRDPAGEGLKFLGPADFTSCRRDGAVEGHVLGFERGHGNALAFQPASQRGNHRTFARIGGGALNHQGVGTGHDIPVPCLKLESPLARCCHANSFPGSPKRSP